MVVVSLIPDFLMKRALRQVLCIGVLLAGSQAIPAADDDPFADFDDPEEAQPASPAEEALNSALKKLGPRLNGFNISSDGDGTCNVNADLDLDRTPDFSALKDLPVRKIEVMGNMDLIARGEVLDLSPFGGLPLESLSFWKVPLKDLAPLAATRLKKLSIMGAEVSDVSPLKDLPLTHLDLWATDVSDIRPLRGLRLKYLNIDSSESARVDDLTPLEGMELEALDFHANGVMRGIEIVRSMKSLKKINRKEPVDFWKEYDADAAVRETVAKAGLKFTRLDGGADGKIGLWFHGDDLVDLLPLRELPVTFLGFRESKVSDLRALAGMSVKSLCIASSALKDLSPLRGTTITSLYLDCEQLADLSPLRDTKLTKLTIGCPEVTDLSPPRNLAFDYLNLQGSGVTDLSPLEGMSIQHLSFDPGKITKGLEALREVKSLEQISTGDINVRTVDDFFGAMGRDRSADDPFDR